MYSMTKRFWAVLLGLAGVFTGLTGYAQNATASAPAAPAAVSQPAAGTGSAAPVPAEPKEFPHGQWLLTFQNDWFYGTDRDLTNSLSLYYISPNYKDWAPVPGIPVGLGKFVDRISFISDPNAVVSSAFYAQQNIYTPSNITLNPPSLNDRPYAGWVGMGIDMIRQTANRRTIFEITPGWVGPESGAEQLQTAWHTTIGVDVPKGWYYQIKNEPVLQLTYRQDWRPEALSNLREGQNPTIGYDVIVDGRVTAGNGWDYAAGGVMARVGYHLPLDYGPARPTFGEIATMPYQQGGTSSASTGWSADALSVYVCLAAEGQAVAHDITLDGNTFANSRSVVNEPFIGQPYGGIVVEYGPFYSAFISTYTTKTFRAQVDPQWEGIATLGFRF
jgi:hypothetical protein